MTIGYRLTFAGGGCLFGRELYALTDYWARIAKPAGIRCFRRHDEELQRGLVQNGAGRQGQDQLPGVQLDVPCEDLHRAKRKRGSGRRHRQMQGRDLHQTGDTFGSLLGTWRRRQLVAGTLTVICTLLNLRDPTGVYGSRFVTVVHPCIPPSGHAFPNNEMLSSVSSTVRSMGEVPRLPTLKLRQVRRIYRVRRSLGVGGRGGGGIARVASSGSSLSSRHLLLRIRAGERSRRTRN